MKEYTKRNINKLKNDPNDWGWESMTCAAYAINDVGQASDPAFDNDYGAWAFESGSTEQLWFIYALPQSWAVGTDIIPGIYWMPTTTDAGNVMWRITYRWGDVDQVAPTAVTNTITVDSDEVAYKHQHSEFDAIRGKGHSISGTMSVLLERIGGTDTYSEDVLLRLLAIHYQMDSNGSYDPDYKLTDDYAKIKGKPKKPFRVGAW